MNTRKIPRYLYESEKKHAILNVINNYIMYNRIFLKYYGVGWQGKENKKTNLE